ncbi:integrase [Dictyobacter sp. S3.2.2.5]|uniref:Integrase n=1 Tax=Dictyobacter halimunensis TaxID=3026934 RepID=A0ABQ6FNR6_9CHLR|nr:integrase [Dictyobacter sp. S3.2.2.5]
MQEIPWHYYPNVTENPITRAFIESQVKRQKRPKTIDAYARNLEDLIRAFALFGDVSLVEAGPDLLERYIDNLYHRAPARIRNKVTSKPCEKLSPNTIQQRIVTARLFYDFCIYHGYRQNKVNPLSRGSGRYGKASLKRGVVSRKQQLPWIPSDQEWEYLMKYLVTHESTRNQLMILLAYDGALRREELVSLRVDDFDWSAKFVTVRPETSKSGYQRIVTYCQVTAEVLKHYLWSERANILAAFGGDKNGPLFLSESNRNAGHPVTLGTFNDVIERLRSAIGLPYLTPHTFRHLRCTVLKRCGIDLEDIALYAGHQSIATTQLYIHLAPSELNKHIREATALFDAHMEQLIRSVAAL